MKPQLLHETDGIRTFILVLEPEEEAMTASSRPDGLTRRRAETRQRLIDAAYEVFAESGIRDAPVEVICDRAGYTRGAFYSNFDSKEQLFLAVFEAQTQDRIDRLREAVNDAIEAAAAAEQRSVVCGQARFCRMAGAERASKGCSSA